MLLPGGKRKDTARVLVPPAEEKNSVCGVESYALPRERAEARVWTIAEKKTELRLRKERRRADGMKCGPPKQGG